MKQNILRPMLAATGSLETIEELLKRKGALYASYKIDGWRARVVDGKLLTRRGLPVPNRHTYNRFSFKSLSGFDGELVYGSPNVANTYNATHRAVSTEDGFPDVKFYVFDNFSVPNKEYRERLNYLGTTNKYVSIVEQKLLETIEQVKEFETLALSEGYEGLILRDTAAPYKFGRATIAGGWLVKLKRFEDSEARVMSTEELFRNTNEAKLNGQGYTERSSALSGKQRTELMGKLYVQDVKHPEWKFWIGSGFTTAQRQEQWREGDLITYKYLPIGMKDLPRQPIFKGRRSQEDLS